MTNRPLPEGIRSGRRFAADIDQPRDKTLGLMVSDSERQQIDAIAACLGKTRSSFLTTLAVSFVNDCLKGEKPEQVADFYRECTKAYHGDEQPVKIDRK